MASIVIVLAIFALIISLNFTIVPLTYFDGLYNIYFVYGLIVYKLIELPIIYYILLHRHLSTLKTNSYNSEWINKFKKRSQLLYFLILQGNTIFGIIAYKLSGNVLYYLLFSLIALSALYITKPNDINRKII